MHARARAGLGLLAILTLVNTGWLACSDSSASKSTGCRPPTEAGTQPEGLDGSTDGGSAIDGGVGIDGGTAIDGGAAIDGGDPRLLPKFVGNIDTRRAIRPDFATYWNQYTPENAGKWGLVERTRGTYNWAVLDASYQYCNDHAIIFKQHNFIWGTQQPAWTADLTPDDGPATVQRWMRDFCARYPNTKLIDVVNEPPPHTTPAYVDAIGGVGATGWDWIVNAFTWAHDACPGALLILNDYSNIENASEAQHTVDIANVLQRAGAPIGGIGCQAHGTVGVPTATLEANIDLIARATGLPVYITEYDLDVADDARQAAIMQDQFTMFWTNGAIKGITLWGYVFGSTWEPATGLIQSDGTPRPAMTWLMGFLGR